jgi:hypothetical protein
MSESLGLAGADGLGVSAADSDATGLRSRDFARPATPDPTAAFEVDVCIYSGIRRSNVPLT